MPKPRILALLWLAFLAATMWTHVCQTHQPPLYDALSYYQKACNFWIEAAPGRPFNPLSVEPSYRPPGTVLMSYPFGMEADFRGFFFRSVFLPVALLALAIYVAGTALPRNERTLLVITVFGTSLPCWYYFDVVDGMPMVSFWGMVDNFHAGVAALAMASALRSLRNRSLWWLGLAALLSSYCLLIKPSGGLVMALLLAVWLSLGASGHCGGRYMWPGLLLLTGTYATTAQLCFHSNYLSNSNLQFGKTVVALNQVYATRVQIFPYLHGAVGELFPLALMALAVGWPKLRSRLRCELAPAMLAAAAVLIFAVGVIFWFVAGGIHGVRYLSVFTAMSLICLVPLTVGLADTLQPRTRRWAVGVFLAPALGIALLMCVPAPPDVWQRICGVNVAVGRSDGEAAAARRFASTHHDARIYALDISVAEAVFNTERFQIAYPQPIETRFTVLRPDHDWTAVPVIRIGELESCQFILHRKLGERDRNQMFDVPVVGEFWHERRLFAAWLSELSDSDGVQVEADMPVSRLLRISELKVFHERVLGLLAKHRWPAIFVRENRAYWNP